MISTVKLPVWFSTADLNDVEREIIGLVIEREGLPIDSVVVVSGVRPHAAARPWTTVKRSRLLREFASKGWHFDIQWRRG
jgi:hypothetical protein